MTPEQQQQLKTYLDAIGEILYSEADPKKVQTLEGIEETLRSQAQEYLLPQLGFFLSKQRQEHLQEELEQS